MYCVGASLYQCGVIDTPALKAGKLNGTARFFFVSSIFDAAISITSLVIGILSVAGVLKGLPNTVTYGFIALSGWITLSWVIMSVVTKGDVFRVTKDIIRTVLGLPVEFDEPKY